jgi:hypothetical protein
MARSATPTPRSLYVHDDLTDDVGRRWGADSEAARQVRALMTLVARDAARVRILTLAEQIGALAATGLHAPFDVAIGIGGAGERVARQVHARTGWFPAVERIELTREENDAGGYDLSTRGAGALETQLKRADGRASIAVVDDTVFSGLTMLAVLRALPAGALARTRAFCLRAAGESLAAVRALCPVAAGFVAPGRLLHDVSFINASGLVRRGAIRRAGGAALAFYERPEWMRAWFGGDAADITARCAALAGMLEAD